MEKNKKIRLIAGAIVFAAGLAVGRIVSVHEAIPLAIFALAFILLGGDVIFRALRYIIRGQIFDENFLMSVATIGAFIIGENAEAVGVMLFYQIGEWFQETAVGNSKKSIASLMDIRPDYAHLQRDGGFVTVPPDTVCVGDVIMVKPGERIPLDGIVIEGASMLDTSALTGESVPRTAAVSDQVLSGCVNQSSILIIEVTKPFGESTVAKIIELVENASSKKAKTENFITTFARYYTPAVVSLAVLLAVAPPVFFGGVWREWINRGLIFLVISCPCALVLSIPMGFFAGIGRAAKNGILVKGGNYLEAFNSLDTVVFDKTGTLTKGIFKVTAIRSAHGFTDDQLLEYAAHIECFSNHPIAHSIVQSWNRELQQCNVSEYTEIAGCGICAVLNGKRIAVGNARLMEKTGVSIEETHDTVGNGGSGTKVYVSVDGIYAGCFVISDEIKDDSRNAIHQLKAKGIRKIAIFTGDNPDIANAIAGELGIGEVYGGLLPHEKVAKLECLKQQNAGTKRTIAFVGDGINDAPVLALADIGIAMGGIGSDAAIEAADVVLMTDEPSKLAEAIDVAHCTRRIVWQNIIFALAVKTAFLILGAFGFATMWEAVFADVGVSLLAVLNAMRILKK